MYLIQLYCCRIAYTALEDHESAFECYRKALELDPSNQSYQNNLEIAEQKLQEMAANVSQLREKTCYSGNNQFYKV